MSGIGVFITNLTNGMQVGRRLHVEGEVSHFQGALHGVRITFPGGVTYPANAPGGGPFNVAGGSFSWDGVVPATVRPGEPFVVTIDVWGSLQTRGFPEPEFEDGDGTDSRTLWLEYVVPSLQVDGFQSVVATTDATYLFTLSGSVGGNPGDPYFLKAQYQIGSNAPVALGPGAFSVQVPLAPGQYPITVTASDQFTQAASFQRTLTVLKYNKPADNPALPHTAVGIPTTASVTSWTRLEPQCSDADLDATSQARLFDPLWLTARQWQVGEFQGEDTGSPVQARVRATTAPLSRFHAGELTATSAQSSAYRPGAAPLEALVERRPMRPAKASDLRMLPAMVDAGLHFLRMLELDAVGAKYRAAFLARYALPALTAAAAAAADPDTVRFVATMAGRAPDARQLAFAFRTIAATTFAFDAALGVVAADVTAVQKVCAAWLALYNGLYSEPRSGDEAWMASRLEYALSVASRFSAVASDDLTLSASEFDGGRLDWMSFDVNRATKLDTTGDRAFAPVVATVVPAPVTFKGAPAARFWEMEDAKVAYGLLTVGPTDLAHLMMIEYASSFGNDWYVVPLPTPVGGVTRVESLVVTDTFGVRSLLRPMGDPALDPAYFSMWQLTELRKAGEGRKAPAANAFFLPPTLARSLDGEPLEDVLFMRDEMANLAWGIERSIEGGAGTAVSLAYAAQPPPDPAAHYVLSTVTPDNWAPLMPVQVDANGTVQLKRAQTLQIDGSTKLHPARSAVLNAQPNLMLYDEEIPREGVRITQRRRLARWTDGSTWVWTAFRNEVGRGEGSAGLRFDQVGDG